MMTLFKNKQASERILETLEPVTSTLPPVLPLEDTHSSSVHSANPMSMGSELNLIRAVSEYGATRIKAINRELDNMRERTQKLTHEKEILEKLVAVVQENT
jgi:hypothetical protein